jgi:hypothetical protein
MVTFLRPKQVSRLNLRPEGDHYDNHARTHTPEANCEEDGRSCKSSSSVICNLHQILLGWSNQGWEWKRYLHAQAT